MLQPCCQQLSRRESTIWTNPAGEPFNGTTSHPISSSLQSHPSRCVRLRRILTCPHARTPVAHARHASGHDGSSAAQAVRHPVARPPRELACHPNPNGVSCLLPYWAAGTPSGTFLRAAVSCHGGVLRCKMGVRTGEEKKGTSEAASERGVTAVRQRCRVPFCVSTTAWENLATARGRRCDKAGGTRV